MLRFKGVVERCEMGVEWDGMTGRDAKFGVRDMEKKRGYCTTISTSPLGKAQGSSSFIVVFPPEKYYQIRMSRVSKYLSRIRKSEGFL